MASRPAADDRSRPLSIYQLHADSWMRFADGTPFTYAQLSRELATYVKAMGYTHIELIHILTPPASENGISFFPEIRHGTAKDFCAFVDTMHEAGVGVIVSCPNPPAAEKQLLLMIRVWAEIYHVDGLDFSVDPHTAALFGSVNAHTAKTYPQLLTIARHASVRVEGLGFSYIWDSQWTENCLGLLRQEKAPSKFSVRDDVILAIPEEQVSQERKSLLDSHPGDYSQKFAALRTFFTAMMAHPGKKLLFMTCEYGQFRSWSPDIPAEWFLMDYPAHAALQRFSAELGQLYLSHPVFWQTGSSFSLTDTQQADCAAAFFRQTAQQQVLTVINYSSVGYPVFRVGVPEEGRWQVLLASDDPKYGGSGAIPTKPLHSRPIACGGCGHSVSLPMAPYSAVILQRCDEP